MMHEKMMIKHLGCGRALFPRGVASYKGNHFERRLINTPNEYINYIHNNPNDVYVEVYSKPQSKNNIYDKVYIDIDASDLRMAYKGKNEVMEHFIEYYDYIPRLYFSASKGFAVYIDIPEINVDRHSLRTFVKRELGLEVTKKEIKENKITKKQKLLLRCIDTSVLGDKRRVSRPPFTYNLRNNVKKGRYPRMCIPVDHRWTLSKILKESKDPRETCLINVEPQNDIASMILTLDSSIDVKTVKIDVQVKIDNKESKRILDYLYERAESITDGRTRLLGFVIVRHCMNLGYDLNKTNEFCKHFLTKCPDAHFDSYRSYIESCYEQNLIENHYPWSLQTLVYKFPELITNFDVDKNEEKKENNSLAEEC